MGCATIDSTKKEIIKFLGQMSMNRWKGSKQNVLVPIQVPMTVKTIDIINTVISVLIIICASNSLLVVMIFFANSSVGLRVMATKAITTNHMKGIIFNVSFQISKLNPLSRKVIKGATKKHETNCIKLMVKFSFLSCRMLSNRSNLPLRLKALLFGGSFETNGCKIAAL